MRTNTSTLDPRNPCMDPSNPSIHHQPENRAISLTLTLSPVNCQFSGCFKDTRIPKSYTEKGVT